MDQMILGIEFWAVLGFCFAAYAVVGNDALQTLGTFINSNRHVHWTVLFAFAAIILVAVFTWGWWVNEGDPSFGRLANTDKYPVLPETKWYHAVPPLVLLLLTRLGIPVSTTFLVLTIFATIAGLNAMLIKSGLGYIVAFATGGILYAILTPTVERHFRRTEDRSRRLAWVILQWTTTAYLWGVWLMQDFANIFVFLPRELTAPQSFSAMAVIVILLGITFANRGGPVQKILQSKTAVTDIRSATIIDFVFASLLLFFKDFSNIPMSTTWVFLGLIGGREYAMTLITRSRSLGATSKIVGSDAAKALLGLGISVALAVWLPPLAERMGG
jgi:phosphate/sulfate permease